MTLLFAITAYGALCAIAGGSFTALMLFVFYGPFVKRVRPLEPRDYAMGDLPNIPEGVVALHRSGDRP